MADPCTPEADCETFCTYVEYDNTAGQRDCDSILGCGDWYWSDQIIDPERAAELGDVEQGGLSEFEVAPDDYSGYYTASPVPEHCALDYDPYCY